MGVTHLRICPCSVGGSMEKNRRRFDFQGSGVARTELRTSLHVQAIPLPWRQGRYFQINDAITMHPPAGLALHGAGGGWSVTHPEDVMAANDFRYETWFRERFLAQAGGV